MEEEPGGRIACLVLSRQRASAWDTAEACNQWRLSLALDSHLERTLDLSFVRDFVQQTYAGSGRPSIDPIVFFKLQLVMFFEGIRSERQLMRHAADRFSSPLHPREKGKGGDPLLHPPDVRPHTPAKGYALCTP